MTPIERFFDVIDRGIQAAISFIDTLVSRLLAALNQIARGLTKVASGLAKLTVYIIAFSSVLLAGLDLNSTFAIWFGMGILLLVLVAFGGSLMFAGPGPAGTSPASSSAGRAAQQTPLVIWVFFLAGLFFAVDWYLGTRWALTAWQNAERALSEYYPSISPPRRR